MFSGGLPGSLAGLVALSFSGFTCSLRGVMGFPGSVSLTSCGGLWELLVDAAGRTRCQ